VLGTGEAAYEDALRTERGRRINQLAVKIGYDEALAHQIEAGVDIFLMPSRFEPCGLNQMYSLRYGAVPIVRRVGGLADTVVDASDASVASGRATGFVFGEERPEALLAAVERALALYGDPPRWQGLVRTGMQQDFSWEKSALDYARLYETARQDATRPDR
jgi:starch synthase